MTHFQTWNYPVFKVDKGWMVQSMSHTFCGSSSPIVRSVANIPWTEPNLQKPPKLKEKKTSQFKTTSYSTLPPREPKTFLSTVSVLKREDRLAWKKPKPCTKRCTRPICSRSSRLEIYDSERRDSLRLWDIYMLMLIKNKERNMKWYHISSSIDVIQCKE